jgi:hypothetical protein
MLLMTCKICGKDYDGDNPQYHKCRKKDVKAYSRIKQMQTDEINKLKSEFERLVVLHAAELDALIRKIQNRPDKLFEGFFKEAK